MKIVFVFGFPSCGKFTIARELSRLTGYKLFHNHLVVDAVSAVFPFGSPSFNKLREQMWLSVFRELIVDCDAEAAGATGLIFTFSPDNTVSADFLPQLQQLVDSSQGKWSLDFVHIECPYEELCRRISNESRQQFGKLTDLELFQQLYASDAFSSPWLPTSPAVSINSTSQSAVQSAQIIINELGL